MTRSAPTDSSYEVVDSGVFDVDLISRFALNLLRQYSLSDLLWELAQSVGNLLGFDDCVVYLREGDVLVQEAAFGIKNPQDRDIRNRITIPVGSGIVGAVCLSGQSELVHDTESDPRYIFDEYSGRSELTVPIVFEGEVLGVLDSEADVRNGFSEEDLLRFEALANICAPRIAQSLTQRDLDRTLQDLRGATERAVSTNRQLQREIEVRKGIEQELHDYQDHLQKLVEERTRELREKEAQLHQTQKLEAIGRLAGGIAHDFNNVLSGISGYTTLALASADIGPAASGHLQQVRGATKRAVDLVNQILSFSHNSSSEKSNVDMVEVVTDALKLAHPTLPSNIDLSLNTDLEEAVVLANRTQMQRMLLNLVANAAAAIGSSQGRIDLRLARDAGYLNIVVSDTGCGIADDDATKIFDPFFTTKVLGEGTGLGLSIVSSIVDEHGGRIAVASQPGDGASFTIYLPLAQGRKSVDAPDDGELKAGSGQILLVDDEQMILNLYGTMLTQIGYEVTKASDGEQALELYRAQPERFDLVISDETMPNMHGSRLALKIREMNPRQPFILCSGFSPGMDDNDPAETGIHRFLQKPVELATLADAVSELIKTR